MLVRAIAEATTAREGLDIIKRALYSSVIPDGDGTHAGRVDEGAAG